VARELALDGGGPLFRPTAHVNDVDAADLELGTLHRAREVAAGEGAAVERPNAAGIGTASCRDRVDRRSVGGGDPGNIIAGNVKTRRKARNP